MPTIAGAGTASIGESFSVVVAEGTGGARGYLFVGMNGPAGGAIHVRPPFQVVPFELGGSKGVPGAGSTSIAFPVPHDATLIGTRVNFQARILDAPAHVPRPDRNVTLTGGLEVWVL